MRHLKLFEGFITDFYATYKASNIDMVNKINQLKSVKSKIIYNAKSDFDSKSTELENDFNSSIQLGRKEISEKIKDIFFTLTEDFNLRPIPLINPNLFKKSDYKGSYSIGFQFMIDDTISYTDVTPELIAELRKANNKLRHMGMTICKIYLQNSNPSSTTLTDIDKYIGTKAYSITVEDI